MKIFPKMFIKEIIVEGFKSYNGRSVVGPFDPGFNVVTGLNGSGKSNLFTGLNSFKQIC